MCGALRGRRVMIVSPVRGSKGSTRRPEPERTGRPGAKRELCNGVHRFGRVPFQSTPICDLNTTTRRPGELATLRYRQHRERWRTRAWRLALPGVNGTQGVLHIRHAPPGVYGTHGVTNSSRPAGRARGAGRYTFVTPHLPPMEKPVTWKAGLIWLLPWPTFTTMEVGFTSKTVLPPLEAYFGTSFSSRASNGRGAHNTPETRS
eukprot:2138709-Pyramimonas_sp.AAC.1